MKPPVSISTWWIFLGGMVLGIAGTRVYQTMTAPERMGKEAAAASSVAEPTHLPDEMAKTNAAIASNLSAGGGSDAQTRAQLLQQWMRRDPAAAWRWVIENGKREPGLLKASLYQMAAIEPDRMMQ